MNICITARASGNPPKAGMVGGQMEQCPEDQGIGGDRSWSKEIVMA